MKVLICYDVAKDKVRRELVKYLESLGMRLQYSVFLADLSESEVNRLNMFADQLLEEGDSFYIYKAGDNCSSQKEEALPPDCLIV